jgi:hypothetical protein
VIIKHLLIFVIVILSSIGEAKEAKGTKDKCPPCYYTMPRKTWNNVPYPYPKNWNGKASSIPPGNYYYNCNQYVNKYWRSQNTVRITESNKIVDGTPTIKGKSVIRPETFRDVE